MLLHGRVASVFTLAYPEQRNICFITQDIFVLLVFSILDKVYLPGGTDISFVSYHG